MISISNKTLKLQFFALVVEIGHAKGKMRKQHVLKMWIIASGFKMLFLSVKESRKHICDEYIYIATFVEVV